MTPALPPPDLSEPTILEVLTEFFAEPDHNQCRSMGPEAEAECFLAGMKERGLVLSDTEASAMSEQLDQGRLFVHVHVADCASVSLDDMWRGPCDCEADELCSNPDCEECADWFGWSVPKESVLS